MVFDSLRNRIVLFGGADDVTGRLQDTWEYDGTSWQLRATTGPSPRAFHSMAFDSTRNVTVLFGGETGQNAYIGDTWTWNGTTWTQRITAGSPLARGYASMAFDSVRGRAVLCGGYNGTLNPNPNAALIGDTWEWTGAAWIQRDPSAPAQRKGQAMAFDPVRNKSVIFGGSGLSGQLADTLEWNGSVWSAGPAGPSARDSSAMVFDSLDSRLVLIDGSTAAGFLGDAWSYTGTWVQHPSTGPGARYQHAVAYDSARHVIVLFGGADETVGLRGDTWEGIMPPAPVITTQPVGQSVWRGMTFTLSVAVTAPGPMTYQWRRNGVPLVDGPRISGATTQQLRVSPVQESDAGDFDVVVSHICSLATSSPATLTVPPCVGSWIPGVGLPVVAGASATYVSSIATFANGDFVIAGSFNALGTFQRNSVARWNASTTSWSVMASTNLGNPSYSVYRVATLPNGDVVAGGNFPSIEGVPANAIARWSAASQTWSPLGAGVQYEVPTLPPSPLHSGIVADMGIAPNGDILVCGDLDHAGGMFVPGCVARWTTSTGGWSSIGNTAAGCGTGGLNSAIASLPNGDVVSERAGVAGTRLAMWSSLTNVWTYLPDICSDCTTHRLQPLPNGDVVAISDNGPHLWNHSTNTWRSDAWLNGTPRAGAVVWALSDGDYMVGTSNGSLIPYTETFTSMWKESLQSWVALDLSVSGGGLSTLAVLPGGDVIVGGSFTAAGGLPSAGLAKWGAANPPTVPSPPNPLRLCPQSTARFTLYSTGGGPTLYQWQVESPAGSGVYVDLTGNLFAEPVSGLAFTVSGTTTAALEVSNVHLGTHSNVLRFVGRVNTPCGGVTSSPTTLTIVRSDFNCSGSLGVDDIFDYLNAWLAGDPRADLNGDGLSVQDIFDFLNAWFGGT